MVFMFISGFDISSIRYRVFKDGSAMKISTREGTIVHIVSNSCPSIMNLLYFFCLMAFTIK